MSQYIYILGIPTLSPELLTLDFRLVEHTLMYITASYFGLQLFKSLTQTCHVYNLIGLITYVVNNIYIHITPKRPVLTGSGRFVNHK